LITFLTGWFVTIPLAFVFVFYLNINLQGLVAAITIGYSVSSTALLYLLIRSNWSKRVEKVKCATVEAYAEHSQNEDEHPAELSFSDSEYGDTPQVELMPFE